MLEAAEKYFLQPGFIFVSEAPYLIHTVLGSCVAVCLWDTTLHFGGMNHYIYARAKKGNANGKYGNASISHLVRMMIEMGCKYQNLRAHIIGGAENMTLRSTIGTENVEIAEELLGKSRINVVSRDVGGNLGRKVVFNNSTGEVLVYKVENIRRSDWYDIHRSKN